MVGYLIGVWHLAPYVELFDVLEASPPFPLMQFLTRGIDMVLGVLRDTEEAVPLVVLKHPPKGFGGLAVLVGVRVVDEVSADDQHRTDVVDLLDELPWEVLVVRDQFPVGFCHVDLPENRAKSLAPKDLLNAVVALHDFSPPKQAKPDLHNCPVVVDLRVLVEEPDVLRDLRGKKYASGILVPVVDAMSLLAIEKREERFCVLRMMVNLHANGSVNELLVLGPVDDFAKGVDVRLGVDDRIVLVGIIVLVANRGFAHLGKQLVVQIIEVVQADKSKSGRLLRFGLEELRPQLRELQ